MNGVPRGLVENRYNTLQPRVGFSYDLFGNAKTVLRGGFGTFYERTQGNDIYSRILQHAVCIQPEYQQYLFQFPRHELADWSRAPLPRDIPIFVTGVVNLARHNYTPPAVAMYSLGVQHQFLREMVGLVQYVGNAAWHQWDNRHINNIPRTVGNVTIPQSDGTSATVPVTCLAGDPATTRRSATILRASRDSSPSRAD